MAFTVGTVQAKVGADLTDFNRAMGNVRKKGMAAVQQVGRKMKSVGTALTGALTLPLIGAGALAVKTAADYERLKVQLSTLAGSAEAGAMAFKQLKQFSAGTPFQLDDIIKANNIIVGMGRSMNQAFNDVQMLGDVASATGANINELARTFGQAAAEGKLMTRDIREFINRGIPLTKLLADSMGVAQDQIFDLASQGKISFEVLQKALKDATTGTGIYAGATEDAANTIHGVLSTLKDNVNGLLSEIGNSLVETFDLKQLMKDLTVSIQRGIKWFNSLSDETKKMAFTIAGLLGASGPILIAIGALTAAIGAITAPIAGVVAGVAVGAAAIISNWEDVETYFTTGGGAQMWESIKKVIDRSIDAILRIWDTFGERIMAMAEHTFTVISETLRATFNGISIMIDTFTGRWLTDWDGYMKDSKASLEAIYGRDGSARIILEEFLLWAEHNWIVRMGHALGAGLGNMIIQALNSLDITSEDIPLIKDLDERIAESISLTRSNRALARAKDQLMSNMKVEDEIIPADIDVSMPNITGQKMGLFEGMVNPVKRVDTQVQSLNTNIKEGLAPGFQNMRASVNPALEGLSLLEIGAMNVGGAFTRTMTTAELLGQKVGEAFAQAAVFSDNLLDSLKNIAKQLASRAIIKFFSLALSGGLSEAFSGGLFKGIGELLKFHSGGIVGGSGDQPIIAKGGEGVFTRAQMGALGLMARSGGDGKTVIKNHLYIDGREVELALEDRRYSRSR